MYLVNIENWSKFQHPIFSILSKNLILGPHRRPDAKEHIRI